MKRIWFPLLVISVILFAVGVALLAQSPAKSTQTVVPLLVLYDDFNGPRIAVNTATVSGCQSNPSAGSTAWTGLVGRFFNTGSGNGDDDVMGDIGLFRESTDPAGAPLRVQATLSSGAGYYDARTLGYVALGQTAKLHLKWDPASHQFVFQLNHDPVVPIGYGFSDTNPPAVPFKEFYASRGVPNCTTTPLGSATMDTYFDNVYVNPH